MNTLRRMIFFFIALFIFAGAYGTSQVFAVPQFNFEINSPVNLTTLLTADATAIGLSFNLTNATGDAFEGGPVNNWNVTNVSIFAILSDATEVELGVTGPSFLDAVYDRGVTYIVTKTVVVNATAIPITETTITLNITADIFNGTENGALTNETNFNSSETFLGFSFILDGSAPDVTIKFLDRIDNEQTQFEATDLVRIVCTRSSTGASYNTTNIQVQSAGGGSFETLETDLTRDTTSRDFTVDFTSTLELGDYTVACYSTDDLGSVNNTVNTTFSVVSKPPKSTSAFKNPAFQAPQGQKIVTGVEDLGKVSETGDSRLMKQGASLKVDVNGQKHTITVKDLTTTALTLTIESTPQEITINKGETTEVDVDQDGQNDFAITFHQQYKSGSSARADVTLKAISTVAQPKKEATTQPTPAPGSETQTSGSSSGTAIVIIIVIIAIVIIGFALIRGKKR